MHFREGKLTYVKGYTQEGNYVELRTGNEGEVAKYNIGGWEITAVFFKNGYAGITSAKIPVNIGVNDQYISSLRKEYEEENKLANALRKTHGFSNITEETSIEGLRNLLDLSVGKGHMTEKGRSFAKAFTSAVAHIALEELSRSGYKRLDGEEISGSELDKLIKGGTKVEVSGGLKIFGIGGTASAYGSIEGIWTTKQGWVVKHSDGRAFLYRYNEQDRKAFEEAFKAVQSGGIKDFSQLVEKYSDQKFTDKQFRENYAELKQKLYEYTQSKVYELSKELSRAENLSKEGKLDLTPQFIEYVANRNGLNYEGAVMYLQYLYTNHPEKLREEVSEFVATKINTGDFLYDVEKDTSVKGFNVFPAWVKDDKLLSVNAELEKHVKDSMNFEIKKPSKGVNVKEDIENAKEYLYKYFGDTYRVNAQKQEEVLRKIKEDNPTVYMQKLRDFEAEAKSFAELKVKRDELSSLIRSAEKDLQFKVKTRAKALDINPKKMWELIKNPEKFEEYKKWWENLPFYERISKMNPKNVEDLIPLYQEIQEKKKLLKEMDSELARLRKELDEPTMWSLYSAKNMMEGNYEVKGRNPYFPFFPRIETEAEKNYKKFKED